MERDAAGVLSELKQKYASAASVLMPDFYDPHEINMYGNALTYTDPKDRDPGHLTRSSGPCEFCVNDHWKFPHGCPYGKPDEKQYAIGFLEMGAAAMIASSGAATGTPLVRLKRGNQKCRF